MVQKALKRIVRPALMRFIGPVTHINTKDPVAALTFDDGPHPVYTSRLINILEKYHAHATFFMIGELADRFPKVVQLVADSGHALGNHSWSHPVLTSVSRTERRFQMESCEEAISPFGSKLFRPPYGKLNVASCFDAILYGYKVITWNVVAEDWRKHDPAWMVQKLLNEIRPGSIVLLHDAISHSRLKEPQFNREPMLEAIELLLERLASRYEFVTVPELLRRGSARR